MITHRSQQKELIDLGPDYYTPEEYRDCLKKLFTVNRFFGFFRSTVKLIRRLPHPSSILDIGCGGGLFLLHLSHYFPNSTMIGVDINADAIKEAQYNLKDWPCATKVSFEWQQQPKLDVDNAFDIILATLVCHHLTDEELLQFLQDTQQCAKQAVILNDLHRHWLPRWFYAITSPFLFRNRLISHDGTLSIQRGFTRAEWKKLLKKAKITRYKITWRFPFRWEILLLSR